MALLLGGFCPAEARVTRLVITNAAPAFGGASFGAVGTFEILTGTVYGELDPSNPRDAVIQDLELAPRNAHGKVEYSMDIYIIRPTDLSRGNNSVLYEVPNRGNKGTLTSFNVGSVGGNSPTGAGDGYLQSLGFTLAWGGWQQDVIGREGALLLHALAAHNRDGSVITGRVMTDYEFAAPASTTVIGNSFAGPEKGPEAASTDNADAVLTEQVRARDPPARIPNSKWAFADCGTVGFPGTPSTGHVCLQGGFDTDHIYRLVYTAANPLVTGIGFAATRDWVSFLHYAEHDDYGDLNPVAGANRTMLGLGISQDGRLLRDFLYLGFNRDESGRKVFDGLDVHVAAARMSLNKRFALPGYNALQHETHLAPTQDMPLSWAVIQDPVSGRTDGILRVCEQMHSCPVIFQTMSSLEWWQERESLNTTDGAGHDVTLPDNVRVFHMAGTQHAPARTANDNGVCQQLQNPNPYQPAIRALLPRLRAWAAEGRRPPDSRYPTVASGTLVRPASMRFPRIPGVTYNGLVNAVPNPFRGSSFSAPSESGVISVLQPQRPRQQRDYVVLVPNVDDDGNETDGVRSVNLRVPLGTYTGWNLRRPGFSENELCFLSGSFIPFTVTKRQREMSGDPRRSLEERYGTHAGYVEAVKAAAGALENEGFLLSQDAQTVIHEAEQSEVLR